MPFISTGQNHTLFIDPDDRVWAYGANDFGQLVTGEGDSINHKTPIMSPYLFEARSVSAGDKFSLILEKDGRVWAVGNNESRQLGIIYGSFHLAPHVLSDFIPGTSKIVEISAGTNHCLLLDSDGIVWPFGNNGYHQLGTEPDEKHIEDIPEIKGISAGNSYSLLFDVDGHVWSFGQNHQGQLGLGHTILTASPIMIEDLEGIVKVSAGFSHSLFLDNQGRVWGCGYNSSGELGSIPTNDDKQVLIPTIIPGLPPIKDIAIGLTHSLALDYEGRVWGFGMNNANQLGTLPSSVLVPTIIPDLPPIDSIATAQSRTLMVDVEGNLWTFGNSWFIGLGEVKAQRTPAMIPDVKAKTTTMALSPFIRTTYPIIKYFMDHEMVTDYRIQSRFEDNDDVVAEFDLNDETSYVARIQHDVPRDKVSEPLYDEEMTFYDLLKTLISSGRLETFELRPDIYQDEKGNQGFVFLTGNQFYLVRIYQDDNGDIHRPL